MDTKTNIVSIGSCRINGPIENMNKQKFNILNMATRMNTNGLGVYNTKQMINIIDNSLNINYEKDNPLLNQYFVNGKISINKCNILFCEISSLKIIMYKNQALDINFGGVILKYLFNIHLDSHTQNIKITEFYKENIILFIKYKSIGPIIKNKNLLRTNMSKEKYTKIEDFRTILTNNDYEYLCKFVNTINNLTFYEQTYEQLKHDIEYIISKIPCKIIFIPIAIPLKDISGKLKEHREKLNYNVKKIVNILPENVIYFNINNELQLKDDCFLEYNPIYNKYEREHFGNIDYSHFNEKFNRKYSNILERFIQNYIIL
jgi:hypothetical protein